MHLIKLSYSGHYPDLWVEVTTEELATIRRLTQRQYLYDTEEGRELISTLQDRADESLRPKCETVVAYA